MQHTPRLLTLLQKWSSFLTLVWDQSLYEKPRFFAIFSKKLIPLWLSTSDIVLKISSKIRESRDFDPKLALTIAAAYALMAAVAVPELAGYVVASSAAAAWVAIVDNHFWAHLVVIPQRDLIRNR